MKNIPLFKVFMSEDVLKPVNEVLMSGYVGQGPKVDEFEKLLAKYIGNPYLNTVNSGTSGLQLALHMLNPQPNAYRFEGRSKKSIQIDRNEILTTPLTCTATNFPIVSEGYKIKWVDLDPTTCNLDLQDLRRKLSPNTLAIMVVHWGGYPVDLNELKSIQEECNYLYGFIPPIIEDCAHAFGATFDGKMLGNHGNTCVFSFQAIKHLTTTDGGLIVSPNREGHHKAKLLRWFGLDRESSADFRCEQNIRDIGFKYHMNDVSATIGINNFPHIEGILKKHRANAKYLHDNLGDMDMILMERKSDRVSSDWVFTIRVPDRDDFMKMMKECGIGVGRVHDRNDKHQCLQQFRIPLPTTDLVCSDMCCIPCGWWVEQEDLEYIVECIKGGW